MQLSELWFFGLTNRETANENPYALVPVIKDNVKIFYNLWQVFVDYVKFGLFL